MKNVITIFNREFRSYFSSPIAYVVIGLFLVLTGVFFYLLMSSFLQYSANLQWQAARMRQPAPPVNVNHMIIRPLFSNISVITLFVVPMITMRSFSDDKKTGTLELLLTSPVTTAEIVAGKFLAAFSLYVIMALLTWVYPLVIVFFGDPDVMPVAQKIESPVTISLRLYFLLRSLTPIVFARLMSFSFLNKNLP